ncbi:MULTISPECIES: helix-turn-helix transcriptional regulator [unclassified Aerococcus]|uniref:helix-turn-helix transcriptional regulator n=1 Tax=unclassified Aerococcus TaxID=2618060 RepID=UPI0008A24137|nr:MULTISPECIES: helix-turn-helix transcriptional regulator [unclassified Aerococcus]MDK6369051.1 helix-turn-helix transcriptional regulator [Aerococcus sp. UMB9870]MDK6686544.1 helix-turn-helix transcriptional regulator [Aerococcus sp. UMB8623]OFR35220.1 hypothetical protein HMPREF2892_01350 [Aerococcus sp. HMSC061A03]OFT39737.1 hypothetical protein HMPREF3161_06235 [Aerococcus sp. HMSC06H08]
MRIGANIKDFRKSRRMTQADLGKAVNVTQQTIWSWESGRSEPSVNDQKKLANFFGVSLDTLNGDNIEEKVDLKRLIKNANMTYGGKEISDHDLKVLGGIVESLLGGDEGGNK